MKTDFSVRRLGLILRYDLMAMGRNFATTVLGVGIVLGILNILMTFGLYKDDGYVDVYAVGNILFGMYAMVLAAFVCITIGNMNNVYANKGLRITWLMLPATNFEKYLSRLIYAFVFVPLLAVCILVVAEVIRLTYFLVMYNDAPMIFAPIFSFMARNNELEIWMMILNTMSTFFFGAFLFNKHGFFRTILFNFCIGMLWIIVTILVLVIMFKTSDVNGTISSLVTGDMYLAADRLTHRIWVYIWVVSVLDLLFCLIWPYFRMKDMEIINRY